jgi:hypothetical protein
MRSILAIMPFGKIALIISILSLCFQTYSYAADIKLQWDVNTDPDLDHYVIYWGIDFDPPYGHNSEDKGDFIDKNTTTYTVTGLSDDKTYYFVARAFNTEGLESDWSNVVSTYETSEPDTSEDYTSDNPPPSAVQGGGGGGGGCFIATAAYGSNMDRHVKILSEFRDKHLLTNSIGRDIVDAYHKFSPTVANYLNKHPFARAVVRYALIPITGMAYISLYIHPLALLFAFILLLLAVVYCVRRLPRSQVE